MGSFSFRNLSFAYPEIENNALCDISFDISQGEFLILCGPSGCGKSTLLRHLKTCLTPHGRRTGEIFTLGTPLEVSCKRASKSESQIDFALVRRLDKDKPKTATDDRKKKSRR